MNEQAADQELLISTEGAVGVIGLNRPRAINALTDDMVVGIKRALEAWAEDDGIKAVLIESTSERGFCAGGDVRRVREWVLAGEEARIARFFQDEYAMNATIATFKKPIVAFMGGVVMGGGIGIGGHAGVRIAARHAKFAMPESAIGLMCDVGANALLARVARHRALAFLMPGVAVGSADAIGLNLVDHVVEDGDFSALRAAVVKAVNQQAGPVDLHQVVHPYRVRDLGEPEMLAKADTVEACFEHACARDIVAALEAEAPDAPAAAEFAEILRTRCPHSLEVIVMEYLAAERNPDIAAVLANDLRLAPVLVSRPDFSEGVRAVLVDKDQKPKWQPARLDLVDCDQISRLIE